MTPGQQVTKRKRILRDFKVYWVLPLIFTSMLGISLVHYLGGNLNGISIILGGMVCLSLFAMRIFLNAYFDHPDSPISALSREDEQWEKLKEVKRNLLLQYSLLSLTAGATCTILLIARQALSTAGLIFLGLVLLGFLLCASPPLRLDRNGYGDLVEGVVTVNLVPAFMVSLHQGEVPALLLPLTLPLLLLYIAAKIMFALKDYGFDIMHGQKSLVTLTGWKIAVFLHNLLILGSFVLIGVFLLTRGLPWSLAWPAWMVLPFGIFQVWQVLCVAEGDKPAWKIMLWLAIGMVLMMIYLIQVPLWF